MSYRLHITNTAERDLTQAADYIEFVLKNPSAADALLEEADRKINALLPFPKEHPLVDDKLLASWGIRFVQINNYLAFYVISEMEKQIKPHPKQTPVPGNLPGEPERRGFRRPSQRE